MVLHLVRTLVVNFILLWISVRLDTKPNFFVEYIIRLNRPDIYNNYIILSALILLTSTRNVNSSLCILNLNSMLNYVVLCTLLHYVVNYSRTHDLSNEC